MSSFLYDVQRKYPDLEYRIDGVVRGWWSISAAPLATKYLISFKNNLVSITPYVPLGFPCKRLYIDTYVVGQFCPAKGNIVESHLWEYRMGERDGISGKVIQRIRDFLRLFH